MIESDSVVIYNSDELTQFSNVHIPGCKRSLLIINCIVTVNKH